ncbi:hypothetical protein [Methylocella sp. CPCC 101449]|jgi:hypothetical protein|uniref:hypothetical protein n=1 Tax=Methylocella sp. CPCC 101449 TaxID=2987531 RepID=UPI002890FA6B|nr:hypothetical protein [Methylocella sp. CPCC 101449]MDT2024361.1 hypothetical protein [Methylocella sp. CPCC 101449]HEV2571136.1 hypothetical protein [Beijerinckiaceae bacterium]
MEATLAIRRAARRPRAGALIGKGLGVETGIKRLKLVGQDSSALAIDSEADPFWGRRAANFR